MSDGIKTNLEESIREYIAALARIAANSKKTIPKLAFQNFGGVVKNLFGLTPPMWGAFVREGDDANKKVDFDKGRAKSDNTIGKDVFKATWTLKSKGKQKANDMASHGMATVRAYLACRNARKRYAGGFGRPVSEPDQALISQVLHNRQGFTAAGWVEAAKLFKVPGIPRWITRHGSAARGFALWDNGESTGIIRSRAINPTKHVGAKEIEAKVAIAINMQTNAMCRQIDDMIKKKFKETGKWR